MSNDPINALYTIALEPDGGTRHSDLLDMIHRHEDLALLGYEEFDAAVVVLHREDEELDLPLSPAQARELMEPSGFLTVVLTVDKERYLDTLRRQDPSFVDDEHDLLHDIAFGFGLAYDCTARVVGVQGDDFIVEYTTNIAEALSTLDDQAIDEQED